MANKKKNKLVPMKTSEKPQAKVQIIEMTPKDAGKVPLCGHKDPSKETYRKKTRKKTRDSHEWYEDKR